MGRGRNGVTLQNNTKNKKGFIFSKNYNCALLSKQLPYTKKADIFLDPSFVDYLRNLDPREVTRAVLG